MSLIYNLAIYFYTLAIRIAALWNTKAQKWVEGRKNVFVEIESKIKPGEKIAWFHCSSLGEFEQARPVIELFRERNFGYKILLTFFSPSGYEMRKNYSGADYIFYLPADTVANAKRFIALIKPAVAIFAKYDFWFNYLRELKRNDIPVVVFSAAFRREQYFFKEYGDWFRIVLSNIDLILVQDETSYNLLRKFRFNNVDISGDTRYDRVLQNAEKAEFFPLIEKFRDKNKITVIAGSTWEEDERLIIELIRKRKDSMKYIIAPHEIKPKHINKLVKQIEVPVLLYSQATPENIASADAIIIDNVGILSHLYRYGDIAYIGGGFGSGIHNVLEPAAFSLPVIFGPNYQKFNEAKELINISAAYSVDKYRSLSNKINDLFFEKGKIESQKKRISAFMNSKKGATQIVVTGLEKLINEASDF